ncbi:hypothetical protein GCM10010862_12500 [Devosia nitrariae]|uniref:Carbohydrate binding module xylan-binding domain-containing protein n=2 Tax=Devosia nitrariae TaxID=2071872 RepID=A0ABQ5W2A3_9HYPH|nr:hypothetical protein GCM10010862_12500 [Devosia nitrariae]
MELTLSGTAYDGGPAFEAAIGGEVVATGTIDDPVPEGSVFHFTVDDRILAGNGDLTIRLTNDHYGGEGKDRSLHILGGRVGDTPLAPAQFILTSNGERIERDTGAVVQVWSEAEIAVVNAPPGGWLEAGALPEADAAGGETSAASCSAAAEITGFAHNATASEANVSQALSDVVDVANSGVCSVTITGYADVTGSALINRRITAARAAVVLDHLLASGARLPAANIVATEGTTQFGPDAAANRRVVVQFWGP